MQYLAQLHEQHGFLELILYMILLILVAAT